MLIFPTNGSNSSNANQTNNFITSIKIFSKHILWITDKQLQICCCSSKAMKDIEDIEEYQLLQTLSSVTKIVLRKTNRRINQLFLNSLPNLEALQIAHIKIAKIHFLPLMKWILVMVAFFHHIHTSSVQLIHPLKDIKR